MSKVTIYLGEETRIKIENAVDIKDSLFKEQYKMAFGGIGSYLKKNGNIEEGLGGDDHNNIFAFIGERGTGKSSCMLSVANMLKKPKDLRQAIGLDLLEKKLHVMENIDPSFFDENHNILELIVGQLFSKFKHNIEHSNGFEEKDTTEKKRILIDKFQIALTDLSQISSDKKISEDGLEQLIALASGVNIRKSMSELIEAYLKFFNEDVLVIPIDDIDLNTQYADKMAEQLRKYFINRNVIILMAVKLDQLSLVMKNKYAAEFKLALDNKITQLDSIYEMADRYLLKLIPLGQRIFLPDMEVLFNQEIEIIDNDKKNTLPDWISTKDWIPIKDVVTKLIEEKTGFKFSNLSSNTNYIVPRNLRELRYLISLLCNMDENTGVSKSNNRMLFKKYFYETWTSNNLDAGGIYAIKNILSITDPILFNKSIINILKKHFTGALFAGADNRGAKSDETLFKIYDEELGLILKKDNFVYNISLGDVMAIINYIESIITDINDQKLLFAIRSIYSIKLYEYYNDSDKDLNIEDSNYLKLIGGNFINSKIVNLLPDEKNKGSRGFRPIRIDNIRKLLGENCKEKKDTKEIEILHLVEFFALTISRKYNSKSLGSDDRYRETKECYFTCYLSSSQENVYFDLASIFFNIINIKYAYDRMDEKLYEYAMSKDQSILRQIQLLDTKFKLTNIEVLEEFKKEFEHSKIEGGRYQGGNLDVFKAFFNRVASHFKEFKVIVDVLNRVDEAQFERMFSVTGNVEKIIDIERILRYLKFKEDKLNITASLIKRRIYKETQLEKTNKLIEDIFLAGNSYTKEETRVKLEELKRKLNG